MSVLAVTAGIELIKTVVGKFADAHAAGDVQKKAELDAELQLLLGQIAVNTEEAKSPRLFIAGWRPALAWVCLLDVICETVLFPVFHVQSAAAIGITMPIMLTLIGARSFDKYKEVDTK